MLRKRAYDSFIHVISIVSPEVLPEYHNIMEVTREIKRENVEATLEMDETMVATREMDETMVATREIKIENVEATREMDETMVATREINRENVEDT
ncbi:hypothetical protein TNCV_86861 [Trichonephila clavipes]|nr:hypothetical protein TNCV_86861 [Trichonephila clavipes]